MFLAKTMRYYRLWIYTCNTVLFLSVVLFTVTAIFILTDNRRHLISSIQLYHPSFLYAYIAIPTQAGVVQVVGCVGALRLNKRLLRGYWIILLCLLIGDVLVGFVWLFRLDAISKGLNSDLKSRLITEYTHKENGFKPLFDELQQNDQCCGAYSPLDYNSSWWFKVSNKYVDEYEKLLVNHTNARNMDWDYITKKPLKKLVIPIPLHEHNLTYQRYNDDTNATSTNTYVIKGTTGINKDYKVGREKEKHKKRGTNTKRSADSTIAISAQNKNKQKRESINSVETNPIKVDDEVVDHEHLLLPWSCCVPIVLQKFSSSKKSQPANSNEGPMALAIVGSGNRIQQRYLDKERAEKEAMRLTEDDEKDDYNHPTTIKNGIKPKNYKLEEPVYLKGKWCTYSPIELPKGANWHHRRGCIEPLTYWLNSSTDLLLVIGFCVIGFLKFVFLSILHYEIREMIQKIHMLENETNQMNGGLAAVLGLGPEIRSLSSSADPNGSRSSTPSCHSSQSLHPPQTANTILSYPIPTEKFNASEKTFAAVPNITRGSITHHPTEEGELVNKNTSHDTNFIQMNSVITQQLINTDTYSRNSPLKPLHQPSNPIKSPEKESHNITNIMNSYPNRNLNLDTTEVMSGTSLPHSHDLITSSTATTAQSSSESTINKQVESAKRAPEASILSPQSERWPIRQQNYFQNGSEFCSGGFEGTSKEGKSASEYHELSKKQNYNKCDAIKAQSRGSMDVDEYTKHHRHNEVRNHEDCLYGENKNITHCANLQKTPFIETECIAEGSFGGGSSKQTAI